MATQPKPKPKPEPPDPGDDAAVIEEPPGVTLQERVENLEHRMDALEERVAAPPVGLGRRP
jgi:hypothetical protein